MKEQEIQSSPIFYWESTLVNTNVEQGTDKELLMLFTQEGAATCKATLLLMPTAFSPGCSEGAGAQRKYARKGQLTIASFADMPILTLTQRPATGTIAPGSTILNGVKGMLGREV